MFLDLWYRSGPSRRELGFARGPMPGGVMIPRPMTAQGQIFFLPESLGQTEVVGQAGSVEGSGIGVGSTPTPAEQRETASPSFRGPHGINISGPVITAAIGIAARAAGLPGIVTAVLNAIIGPALRHANNVTTTGEGMFTDISPATGGISRGDYASLSDAVRSSGEDPGNPDVPNPEYDVMLPGPTPSPVGEDQALPGPANTEDLAGDYGTERPAALDIPGYDGPGPTEY